MAVELRFRTVATNRFTLAKLLLCSIEIKVHKQAHQELDNRVLMNDWILLQNANHVFDVRASLLAADHGSDQITQDMWAGSLNGIHEPKIKPITNRDKGREMREMRGEPM
jgi:hypothetical protein